MYKIDFFPGTHGHFLELAVNTFVAQRPFDFNRPLFDKNGACHLHLNYGDPRYQPIVFCKHYSFWNVEFDPRDLVIEIHVSPDYMLAALTNNLVRAGDQPIDLHCLEVDTFEKLTTFPKGGPILEYLQAHHGMQKHYPRSTLRKYFYQWFSIPTYLDDAFNNFNHSGKKYKFPFESLFAIDAFYQSLAQSADFLGFEFSPDSRLDKFWQDFLSCNQGYHSQVMCDQVIHAINSGTYMDLTKMSIVEEAWIVHKIGHGLLENFPSSTVEALEKINPAKPG